MHDISGVDESPAARPHSVIRRIARLFAGIFAVFILVLLVLYQFYLHPTFHEQERLYSKQLAHQINAALAFTLKDLRVISEDWSAWDAMYEAAAGWTPEFEKEALPDEVFDATAIDMAVVVDRSGSFLYSKCTTEDAELSTQPYVLDAPLRRELIVEGGGKIFGLFQTSLGPMFICSCPIIQSDNTGTPRGRLLLGRVIGPAVMQSISEILRQKVYMTPAAAASGDAGSELQAETLSDKIIVSFPARDQSGRIVFWLNADVDRTLFSIITRSTLMYFLLSTIAFVSMVTILILALERVVLRRIRRLSGIVNENAKQRPEFRESEVDGNDEVTVLQRNYNQMIQQIRSDEVKRGEMQKEMVMMAKMATAGKVIASVLHEINNPIRVIKNCLYALEKDPTPSPEYLDLLKSEIKHLGAVTDRLTAFSSVDKQNQEDLVLQDVISETIMSVQTAFLGDARCLIRLVGTTEPVLVKGSRSRLKQVFFNILRNACEAMRFEGGVTVEVTTRDEWARARIMDEGPGVDPVIVDKIFYPFFSSNKEAGMGLGLSISYAIVSSYGGRLWVDPEYKAGACFVVELPAAVEESQDAT